MSGDLNIYLESKTCSSTNHENVLDQHGVTLHSTTDTHIKGHTLDAVITERAINITVEDLAVSDHYVLIYYMKSLTIPPAIHRPQSEN